MKNLGFTLDCHLTTNAHISTIARTCYLELRRLAFICIFQTIIATASLVSTFVLSSLTTVTHSTHDVTTHDVTSLMQWMQNYAAQVILCLPKSSKITKHLKSLHWFPVKVRSTNKIACLCYHCHSSTAPLYVNDMLQIKPSHTHNTCSSSYIMLIFSIDLHTVGDTW